MGLISNHHQTVGYTVPTEYTHMLGGQVVEYNGESEQAVFRSDSSLKCDVENCNEFPHGYLMVGPVGPGDNNNI